jgi:hydrogenase/urease accessory protein HupE
VGLADLRGTGGARVLGKIALKRLLIVALLLAASAAGAHEIGTTQVHLTLNRDDTWSASITTGPQSLVNKLEVEAREPRSSDLNADALRAKLGAFADALARHIHVKFDGAASPARIAVAKLELPADITQPSFVVLLATGPVPPHARNVTWGYDLSYSTYGLVFAAADADSPLTVWLEGDETSRAFPLDANVAPPTRMAIVEQYLLLGFRHILPEGLDHILFVLGIFLLTTQLRAIVTQVTAFTIAHSVTLGLTMYGVISLPSRIVEPLIALSIAYVAIENIVTPQLTPWRPVLVFAFGLLHGMGFAEALRELDLPRSEMIPALVSFNVGIELAQLTIIALAFVSVAAWCRDKAWYRARFVVPSSAAIAAVGVFWTVQRVIQ